MLMSGLRPSIALTEPPPPERPNFFALYPPPDIQRAQPRSAFPSTSTRRPDLFAPSLLFKRRLTLLSDLSIDFRGAGGKVPQVENLLKNTRLTLDGIISNEKTGDEQGGIRLQAVSEVLDGKQHIVPSEIYVFYKFSVPGASATVRGGQFVIPFGLAAVYDTSMHPFQTLYSDSVGIRVDRGAMVEGEYGTFHYAGSISAGTGPNADFGYTRTVLAARLDRHFLTQSGRLQVGGSMLAGRLPDVSPMDISRLSGGVKRGTTVVKSRFAADVQYFVGKYAARGEVIFGADEELPVWGFYIDGRIGISSREGLFVGLKRWDYRTQPLSSFQSAAGYERTVGPYQTLRAMITLGRIDPLPEPNRTQITRQLIIQSFWKF